MAQGEAILIGCSLPHGLIIQNELTGFRAELRGANSSDLIGGYGVTTIDKDAWDMWESEHKDFPALTNGAIFAVKKQADVAPAAADRSKEKTGFEGMEPESAGVKPADEK